MDDAWRIKCSSAWPPPPPPSPPQLPSLLAPPPMVAASQMDVYSHQKFHPFVSREANVEEHAFVQEPMGFSSLNTSSCKASKTEMGNSFLALLSGPSYPLTCDFPQLTKSGTSLPTSKLSACDIGNLASGVDCSVSVPYISALSVHHGSNAIENGSAHSSYSSARLPSISACSHPSVLCNDFQVLGAQFPGSNAGKPITSRAHQGNERGLAVSSTNNINASQQQKSNIRTHPIKKVDASIAISSHASSFIRGCPRVFCMGKVGELFVSDNGLLGVFCLCHSLRMSVAKFCEHSGLHALNPGDAVHLENGETVSQWRRLFFLNIGVRVPDDGSGWDWPDSTMMPISLGRPKANSLLKSGNAEAFQLQEPLPEMGRSEGLPSGNISHFPHVGTVALDKLLSRLQETAENRNSHEGLHISSICNTSSIPVNEHILMTVKENNPFANPSLLKPTFTMGQQNIGNKLISNNVGVVGKVGNFSTLYPSSVPVKSFGGDFGANGTNVSSNGYLMDKDPTPSNIELKLGQPSQPNHYFAMSNTAAMCPQQFLAQLGPQKQPVHHSISRRSDMSRVPEKPTQNLDCALSQISASNGTLMWHACGNMDAIRVPEQAAVNADVDKNSLISLFLSHFSTSDRKTKTQVVENITGRSENFVPNIDNCNSFSDNCSVIDFSRSVSSGIETKSNMNIPEFSNQMEKGKGVRVALEDGFYTAKPSLQNRQMGDYRLFAESSDGHSCHSTSVTDRQNSAFYHQSFSRRLDEPDARHSNELGQTAFLANTEIHDNAFLRHSSARTSSLSASPASGFLSTSPIPISGQASSLSNKMNIDMTKHLVDENTRFPALKHVLKQSRRAHLPASLEMSDQQRQSRCPSNMGILRKGSKDDLISCDDLRHEQHCSNVQEASAVAFRPLHSCCNWCSCGVAENSSGITCSSGLNRICKQTSCIQDTSLYSKEKHVKCPSCHVCNDDELSFLRLFRTDKQIAELAEHDMLAHKKDSIYIPGKCSCSIHLKCLKGCHLYRGENPSNSFLEHGVCGKGHTLATAYDIDHLSQDGRRIALGQFDGSRHLMMNDDCQSAFGRDPSKALQNSDGINIQNAVEILPAVGGTDYQLTENTAKDFVGTQQEAGSLKDQRMSSIYSACSAPVVTEISVEENNLDSCTGGTGDARSLSDPVIDEGSIIEKCGSSDDVIDNAGCNEAVVLKGEVHYQKVSDSDYASCHTSRNQIDETNHQSGKFVSEVNLGKSFVPRKKRNQLHSECTVKESNMHKEPITRGWRAERKKKATKWRRLDGPFTASGRSLIHQGSNCDGHDGPFTASGRSLIHQGSNCDGHLELQSSPKRLKLPVHPRNTTQRVCSNSNKSSGVKRKRCALLPAESLPCSISDGCHIGGKDDVQVQSADYASLNRLYKTSAAAKVKRNFATKEKGESEEQENNPELTGKLLKHVTSRTKGCLIGGMCPRERMVRPVVRGNSGIISIGNLPGKSKPVKIVSLNSVLKLAKRCNIKNDTSRQTSDLQSENAGCLGSKGKTHELSVTKWVRDTGVGNVRSTVNAQVKPKCKEARKRRLSELTGNSKDTKDTLCLPTSGESQCSRFLMQEGCHLEKSLMRGAHDDLVVSKPLHRKGQMRPTFKCSQPPHSSYIESQDYAVELCHTNARKFSQKAHKCQQSLPDSDAFCCVCGSANKDDLNHLLECNNCLIRVHQACYGVSKVPKMHWCCRPCRINSKNIACVLCGYEGGAMTRAVRSRNIVKSLLKALKEETGHMSAKSAPLLVRDDVETLNSSSEVHNSITAGALDQNVTQWVHVVCGLWTPGTRCPNVDTMSAFDVSGVLPATRRMVCSMCNRPGGSCIQCRVVDCSIHFHPWCAHQKGLLQSEIEGVDNENVGFYGRCLLHATHHSYHSDGVPAEAGIESPRIKEFSCARTQGYKGRKKEHGFVHSFQRPSNDDGRCIVPQEQLNAWIHINGQKSCTRGLLKPPASETDYDCRKEYARYKQAKGWKHLVVYKSRIHALGLYTSQFIPRGAMVVEYVGEIVSLRVADKREIEYQSGKKLQYKSACYFFRIDKEHIIDATRKGGIARFVNHSCLPNCVAKVISVRNEKKVVFFAERDINPGEEITYDYHFNHEEEGKKIPCFCHSKNCRRYLN